VDSRYLSATQSVLRDIASVTQRLNGCFDLYGSSAMGGISRVSAHLHLLEHQVRNLHLEISHADETSVSY
jgi:hypothetical protein